eukprot:scaffold25314_cov79-Isochrysis_galbana.AAC.1
MRVPSSPGGSLGSLYPGGGVRLRKPAALCQTQGPSSARSASRDRRGRCGARGPAEERWAWSSRRRAAALRGPKPGTNCKPC